MKRLFSVILIICMLFSMAACRRNSKTDGQSFAYPIAFIPNGFDPQVAEAETAMVLIENCMEGLVRIGTDGKVRPAVAERWDVSSDGKTYTFHLRQDVVWNYTKENESVAGEDFNPAITAADFVYAIRRAVSAQTNAPFFSVAVSNIKGAAAINAAGKNGGTENFASLGVSAPDAHTLVIELEQADNGFLETLTSAVFMPCSETFFEATKGRYGRSSANFLSNGPFYFRNWGDESLTMRRNDAYKGDHTAKPVSVTLYQEEDAFSKFREGTYDAIPIGQEHISDIIGSSYTLQVYEDITWSLILNKQDSALQNDLLCRAFMQALDINEGAQPEWLTQADGLVPSLCTVDGTAYREQAGSANFLSYDEERAKENYLTALEALEISSLEMTVTCTKELEQAVKYLVQNMQKVLGTTLTIKIETATLAQLQKSVSSRNYQMAVYPVQTGSKEAIGFLRQFEAGSSANLLQLDIPGYSDLLNGSTAGLLSRCTQAENRLLDSGAVRPLYYGKSYYALGDGISGIYFYAFHGRVSFLQAERAV